MSNNTDKLCRDSDSSTKPLQITQDQKQTNHTKEPQKCAKSEDFLWTTYHKEESMYALRIRFF